MFYKFLIISVIALFSADNNCSNIQSARADFFNVNSQKDITNFINKYKSNACGAIPAYQAALVMRQAQYVSNPFKKLKFFNEGKDQLEKYIKTHPKDVEGYFNRYVVQKSLPAMLNYYHNIADDYEYIVNNIKNSDIDFDYKNKMIKTINNLNKK